MPESMIVNLSDKHAKQAVVQSILAKQGPHRISIVKYRPRRSDRQNAFYHAVYVPLFAEWWSENEGEVVSRDQAHEMLKSKFLSRDYADRRTGEVISRAARSTTSLSTEEFSAYLDSIAKFLAEFCGIVVPESSRELASV